MNPPPKKTKQKKKKTTTHTTHFFESKPVQFSYKILYTKTNWHQRKDLKRLINTIQ